MPYFVLLHEGQRIALPEGEIVIGRSVSCDIRFNDPAVSREHLQIVVMDGRAAAANLSSGGTILNGERLEEPRRLQHGDVLRFGYQQVRIELAEGTGPVPEARPPAEGSEEDALRSTAPMEVIGRRPLEAPAAQVPSRLAEIKIDICPHCRAHLAEEDDDCPECGYVWPAGHPSARTREVPVDGVTARKEPRFPVSLPVIYASATLTIHAIVRDLSRGGMFIETDVLDPVGTPCEVTALPNGHAAMRLFGYVAHIAGDPTIARMCGLGIQVMGGAPDALEWLERTVARLAASDAD